MGEIVRDMAAALVVNTSGALFEATVGPLARRRMTRYSRPKFVNYAILCDAPTRKACERTSDKNGKVTAGEHVNVVEIKCCEERIRGKLDTGSWITIQNLQTGRLFAITIAKHNVVLESNLNYLKFKTFGRKQWVERQYFLYSNGLLQCVKNGKLKDVLYVSNIVSLDPQGTEEYPNSFKITAKLSPQTRKTVCVILRAATPQLKQTWLSQLQLDEPVRPGGEADHERLEFPGEDDLVQFGDALEAAMPIINVRGELSPAVSPKVGEESFDMAPVVLVKPGEDSHAGTPLCDVAPAYEDEEDSSILMDDYLPVVVTPPIEDIALP